MTVPTARPPFVRLYGAGVAMARERAGLSVDDAVDRLGWESQIVADAETGRPVLPVPAASIAWLYNVSLPELIQQMTTDEPEPPTVEDPAQLTLDGELPDQLWLVEGAS